MKGEKLMQNMEIVHNDIKTWQKETNEVIMELGLGMSLYFPRPFSEFKHYVLALWNQYLDFIGNETLTWARLGGGNKSQKMTKSTYKKIEQWLTGETEYGNICWISAHSGDIDCMGDFGFMLTGYGKANDEMDEEACHLEITFPLWFLEKHTSEKVMAILIKMANLIPFYAGVAGFVFKRSPYKFNLLLPLMETLSKKYLGIEITANDRLCYLADKGLPTVNWLTFIGKKHLNKAGGIKAISEKLPKSATITKLKYGIVVSASTEPSIGDTTQEIDSHFKSIKAVSKALESIQYKDARYAFDDMRMDGTQTVKYLNRLE